MVLVHTITNSHFSGKTVVQDQSQMDIDSLAGDLASVLKEVFPNRASSPNLVLVGHSMVSALMLHQTMLTLSQGGSVVVKACPAIQKDVAQVVGVCNLDVVEG